MSNLIILGIVLTISSFSIWVYNDPGYVAIGEKSAINFPGKLRLGLLRALVPWVSGISKSLGFVKYEMNSIEKIKVSTVY